MRAMLNNVCNITVGRSAVGQWNASDRGQVAHLRVYSYASHRLRLHYRRPYCKSLYHFEKRVETDFSRFVAILKKKPVDDNVTVTRKCRCKESFQFNFTRGIYRREVMKRA